MSGWAERKEACHIALAVLALLVSIGHGPAMAQQDTSRLPRHITPETRAAIDRGLAYLASTQDRQGSWVNDTGMYGGYPVAMTSLAGWALLMDGNTTTQGRYAPNVDRAARYLARCSTESGLITKFEDEHRPMYGHGFAMTFFGQLYGMIEDRRRAAEVHDLLGRGVQLTARSQSWQGGWIYTPNSGGDEGSVTITQVQALRSCRNAGIAVPKEVLDTAMDYLVRSQNSDGGIRYRVGQAGGSRPALAAAAVCCWFNAGQYDDPRALKALAYCKETLQPDRQTTGHDFYAHLYFAQALYVSDDPYWDEYFPQRRDMLLRMKDERGAWVGDGVGDIYGTALALIILQLPFDTLPLMQR